MCNRFAEVKSNVLTLYFLNQWSPISSLGNSALFRSILFRFSKYVGSLTMTVVLSDKSPCPSNFDIVVLSNNCLKNFLNPTYLDNKQYVNKNSMWIYIYVYFRNWTELEKNCYSNTFVYLHLDMFLPGVLR